MKAWIGNLDKYNEGDLVGDWLELPVSKENMQNFLCEKVGLQLTPEEVHAALEKNGVCYEEYFIADIETELSCYAFDSYENLDSLNMLAAYEQKAENIEAVNAYCNNQSIDKIQEICNVILQEDGISLLNMPDYCVNSLIFSDNEKIGYTFAEINNLEDRFASAGLSDYFNYFDHESYGRDISINENPILLGDAIIDVKACDIDLNLYSLSELKEELADTPTQETSERVETDLKKDKSSIRDKLEAMKEHNAGMGTFGKSAAEKQHIIE